MLHLDWIQFFERLTREYGDIVYCKLPGVPLCFVNHPGYAASVLLSDQTIKSKNYRALARIFGNGLIVSNGDVWRRQRRLIQPFFNPEAISRHVDLIRISTERMLDGWRQRSIVDVHDQMIRLTLHIASGSLFGEDMEDQSHAITSSLSVLLSQYSRVGTYVIPGWIPTASNVRSRRLVRKIDSVIAEIIRARKISGEQRGDLLSMLLAARDDTGQHMADRQLRDEVINLFLAGHETTAAALSWTWYLLAQHPEVEAKLNAELDTIFSDRDPGPLNVAKLRYANQVLKESMRLYPPVGGIGRETLTTLQIGEYSVPAGTNIFISQWLMHRNPLYFDEPQAFKPERWTEDFERQLAPFAYMPFGGGMRQCIGASFAMPEMLLILGLTARRFRLRLASNEPIKPVFSISLRPARGIPMFVAER
jgi:cytochrome P450